MKSEIERKVLLNPGPATTSDTVKYAQIVPDICPREQEFGEVLTSLRRDLLKVINASEKLYTTVLFGGSGTAVMEAIISSVMNPDNTLLILVNGVYGQRMCEIADTYNLSYETLKMEWGKPLDFKEAARIIKDKNIDHVAMVHHETTTGILNPLQNFMEFKNESGCTLILDAISSYAGIYIDLNETPIDYLMSTSNKCLQGMPGVAFAICHKESLRALENVKSRSYYLDLYKQYRNLEDKKQTRFTPPVQTIYAMRTALAELVTEGLNNRISRYENNWLTLKKGLERIGFKFLLDSIDESKILLTIIEPTDSNFSFTKLHDLLFLEGFTIYPGKVLDEKTFRLSILGDLTHEDIDNFIKQMENTLVKMLVKVKPMDYYLR
jgi:2-aminoethylphosphonate-pyruvate transaminase